MHKNRSNQTLKEKNNWNVAMYIFDGYYIDQHLLRIELSKGILVFENESTLFLFTGRASQSRIKEFDNYSFTNYLNCEVTGVVTFHTSPSSIDYAIAFNKMKGELDIRSNQPDNCFSDIKAEFNIDKRVKNFLSLGLYEKNILFLDIFYFGSNGYCLCGY